MSKGSNIQGEGPLCSTINLSDKRMKNFEDWLRELKSDERWLEYSSMHHKDETFEKAAKKVYMQGVADGIQKPMQEARKHVYNTIVLIPGDKPKTKSWHEIALEQKIKEDVAKEEEWAPASDEHVKKCVAEFDAMMKGSTMVNAFPRIGYKQSIEEGGWLPKREAPYPATSVRELYVRQRHFAYIAHCFDPRTAQPLPTWMEENEFNSQYDEKEAAKIEKKVYKTLKA